MELTEVNLSRSRSSGRGQQICAGSPESCDWAQLRNLRSPYSSSVEIVLKTWLGFPYICQIFQICPRPVHIHTSTCRTKHSHAIH
eukprot:COSAG01_NODE_5477_length_4236_cov_2.696157_5_plen_85_part_00